ncbi:MAG TPA: DMT family transporter [Roseiflexaceae bacterium]|nr:DMT family transporter [Roseiflexaceae bacterium]
MHARYLAVLLLLGAIWGSSFLFIKIGIESITPAVLVAERLMLAALLMLGILHARGLRVPRQGRVLRDFLLTGAVGVALPFFLITWGEQHIPSGMAAILTATTPLFVVLLSYVVAQEERLAGLKLLGVAIGFGGVIVAVGLEHLELGSGSLWGYAANLGAAVCYAISGLYSRRAFRGMPALLPATGQITCAALVIAPIAFGVYGLPQALPAPRALGALIMLAVFCTTLAYILNFWLLERLGATRSSMVSYLLPPIALVYGALILDETITRDAVVGLLFVLVGIMLANGVVTPRLFMPRAAAGRNR